jgi:DNA-binding transcriptional ArsR family regulator
MKPYFHPPAEAIVLESVLHALSDPVRLSVVRCLARSGDEKTCSSFDVPVHKSTMSHHMRVLREAGIIHIRTEGTTSRISLRRADMEARLPGLLEAVLQAAVHQAAAEEV